MGTRMTTMESGLRELSSNMESNQQASATQFQIIVSMMAELKSSLDTMRQQVATKPDQTATPNLEAPATNNDIKTFGLPVCITTTS